MQSGAEFPVAHQYISAGPGAGFSHGDFSKSGSALLTTQQSMCHPSVSFTRFSPTVNGPAATGSKDVVWFPDSGATHHITGDRSNLQSEMVYSGMDSLLMGNGNKVEITHVGPGTLSAVDRCLTLRNLLCVLDIKRNMLSVSQFARDNGIYFEFHPHNCYVKDVQTKEVLLEGRLTPEGLYEINTTHNSDVDYSTANKAIPEVCDVSKSCVPLQLWHQRLGHPSLSVLKNVLNTCGLAVSDSEMPNLHPGCSTTTAPTNASPLVGLGNQRGPDSSRAHQSQQEAGKGTSPVEETTTQYAVNSSSGSFQGLGFESTEQSSGTKTDVAAGLSSSPLNGAMEDVEVQDSVTINCHPMITRGKNGKRKPKVYNVSMGDSYGENEPKNIHEAMMSDHWKQAAQEEYDALIRNKTWSIVELPPNRTAVNCKWIFRIKRNADGSISRYKARLVAKGFLQQAGLDFHETFSPVVKQFLSPMDF
ncbi:hypothetical protein GQ457_03G013600 [Hibiscus cannabinus]